MSDGLHERIAGVLVTGAKSADITNLIGEAEAAAVASRDAADQARARALDPALSATDVINARRAMDDASFQRDRLLEAVRRLGERLREVKGQEEQTQRRLAYDAALIERDKLATELGEVYPVLSAQLSELITRIAANDALIERLNRRSLPENASPLVCSESIARGLKGFVLSTSHIPKITNELRLPSFVYNARDPYVWPRPRS